MMIMRPQSLILALSSSYDQMMSSTHEIGFYLFSVCLLTREDLEFAYWLKQMNFDKSNIWTFLYCFPLMEDLTYPGLF